MLRPISFKKSYSVPLASRNIDISSLDSAKCVVSKAFSRGAISSQRRYKFADAVNGACGASPQCSVDFNFSSAASTISLARLGSRTSINSANHHVRTRDLIRRINSGNPVRFANVVVPKRFASAKPSLIERMYSSGERFAFSALIARIQSVNDIEGGI